MLEALRRQSMANRLGDNAGDSCLIAYSGRNKLETKADYDLITS